MHGVDGLVNFEITSGVALVLNALFVSGGAILPFLVDGVDDGRGDSMTGRVPAAVSSSGGMMDLVWLSGQFER